ncbi:hypothetical protein D0C36_13270 [Mucilaginibacter conchicola]|uniref:Uncharacterized protein n=2 Tax=Mucilaginibacter conchicola TaxID=2303333 RepID=A0A372NTS7_9SPHI|nr:hypothetical protein D0C36_13270 [Mucilaginibacter conchicola]
MVLIFTRFYAFVLFVAIVLINKKLLLAILLKLEGRGFSEKVGFDKVSSLGSLKNVNAGLRIKKMAAKNIFTTSVTGTTAIRLITTPVAAHKLQPVFAIGQVAYRK